MTDFVPSPERMLANETALLVIDVQEKLIRLIDGHQRLTWNVRRLVDAAATLGAVVLGSEQYPQGLGSTVDELAGRLGSIVAKTSFSCCGSNQWNERLTATGRHRVLVAGIVHIGATLAAPVFGSGNAFQKMRDVLPLNTMIVLPPSAPGRQLLPFMQPDALYAMCRYELTGGPVSVTAAVADSGWVLSLHTPRGDNFYVMPRQLLRRNEVSFLVVPSGHGEHGRAPKVANPTDTQVASPSVEGLIVVRAPLKGVAWQAATETALRRSSCTQVKR